MATLNYYFRLTKNEKDALDKRRKIDKPVKMLYARLRDTDIDIPIRMGIKLDITRWNNDKQLLNASRENALNYDEINSKLRNFKVHVNDEIAKALLNGEDINNTWLENIISSFFNKSVSKGDADINIYFIDYVKYFIERSRSSRVNSKGKPIGKRTIQDYEKTLRKLEKYEKLTRKRIKHLNIDLKFHNDFIDFCRNYEALADKTIGGEIKNLITFLHSAELDGIKVSQDFKRRDFYQPDNETYDVVLTEEEIFLIRDFDLSSSPRLDNARDWFIIGIWTGLRVGDLLSLTIDKIERRANGKDYIQIVTGKTQNPVVLPLHNDVKSILAKRGGNFPYKISDQKFNKYIKEVAEKAGISQIVKGACMIETKIKEIDSSEKTVSRKQIGNYPKFQLITSHTCRRTFATYHYGKLPNFVIMAITGHKSERVFLRYIKKTPNECADSFLELWNKTNEDGQ